MTEMLRIRSEMRCEDCYVGGHSSRTSALGNIHCLCCDDMVNDPVRYARDKANVEPRFPLSPPSRAPEPNYAVRIGYSLAALREANAAIGDAPKAMDSWVASPYVVAADKRRLSRKELKRQLREVLEERNNLKDELDGRPSWDSVVAQSTKLAKERDEARNHAEYWRGNGWQSNAATSPFPWEPKRTFGDNLRGAAQ